MVYSIEDIFFQLYIIHLLIFKNCILANRLHRVQLSCRLMLNKKYLSECTFTNQLLYQKVLKLSISL